MRHGNKISEAEALHACLDIMDLYEDGELINKLCIDFIRDLWHQLSEEDQEYLIFVYPFCAYLNDADYGEEDVFY